MDIDDLAARFEQCAVSKEDWTHAAHLAVGLWHVHRYGPQEALARLRTGIRRLNESHGGVNSSTAGYHETITAAYVRLLSQFHAGCSDDVPLSDRVSGLLESSLADRGVLSAFYSKETLMSTRARAEWVEPDRAPLRVSAVLGDTRSIGQTSATLCAACAHGSVPDGCDTDDGWRVR